MSARADGVELPLFPLRLVLFPGGLLQLKVFEARYLDLVSRCLREGTGFGVVCLREGGEVRGTGGAVQFEGGGTLAMLRDVDAAQAGILQVTCTGTRRFTLAGPASQRDDGLWTAPVDWLPDDDAVVPPPERQPTVQALANAIEALAQQGAQPFAEPHRLDDAGWVANRWCELLPVPLAAKHKLMLLDDPLVRLQLVDEFLRQRGVVGSA